MQRRAPPCVEINGTDVLVQLFENSAGINLSNSRCVLGHGIELGVSEDMLGRVFDGLGTQDGKADIIPVSGWTSTASP